MLFFAIGKNHPISFCPSFLAVQLWSVLAMSGRSVWQPYMRWGWNSLPFYCQVYTKITSVNLQRPVSQIMASKTFPSTGREATSPFPAVPHRSESSLQRERSFDPSYPGKSGEGGRCTSHLSPWAVLWCQAEDVQSFCCLGEQVARQSQTPAAPQLGIHVQGLW